MYVLLTFLTIVTVYAVSFKGSISEEKVEKTVPKIIAVGIIILLLSLITWC